MGYNIKKDDLAYSTWLKKYALKDSNGNILETDPDQMHQRLAKEFARIEYDYFYKSIDGRDIENIINNLSPYGKQRFLEYQSSSNLKQYIEDKFYNLFKDFGAIIPGGSIMANLGNSNQLTSLSNCFVIDSPKDSYASLMEARTKHVHLSKRRGGVGFDLSNLRPRGTTVTNSAGTSTGAASFMEVNSAINNEVGQNNRRGALMLSIHIGHPDALEFIQSKQDLTKVTGANISVKITDAFMKAVNTDSYFYQKFPIDSNESMPILDDSLYEEDKLYKVENHNLWIKKVKARKIWNELIKCAWATAEPGILFIDQIHQNSPDGIYPKFKAISTNPCQPGWATVLTPTGITTFDNINVNSVIWGESGWTTVVNKQNSGVKDVFEYRTPTGVFYGTNTHNIISNGKKVEVGLADSIDTLTGAPIISKNELNIQDIMDGLVIGDKSIHTASSNSVYLCVGKNDKDYFNSEIKDLFIKHRIGINPYAYTIQTTITKEELPYMYLRVIPDRFFYGSHIKIRSFLKGLFSANGSVVDNRITLKTSSEKLRDQVQIMLSSLGIRSYYTTNNSKKINLYSGEYLCKKSYNINITTDRGIFKELIGFLQLYKTNKLNNQSSIIKNSNRTSKITSSKLISNEVVYNITVDNPSHTYWTGGLNVANCGEIPLGAEDSCRLIHQNLLNIIDSKTTFKDMEKSLYKQSYELICLGDNLVDLEIEAINRIISKIEKEEDNQIELKLWKNIKENGLQGRRIGAGFTGLIDTLALLDVNPSKDKTAFFDMIRKIKMIIFKANLDATIDLAVLRGAFPAWDPTLEKAHYKYNNNHWYTTFDLKIKNRMNIYGRRNISFSTVAPTGTVSILTGTTSGIEPLFMPFYKRKRKCNSTNDKVDFIDSVGEKYTEFIVIHPPFKRWLCKNYFKDDEQSEEFQEKLTDFDYLEEIFKESPWYYLTAHNMNSSDRITLQSIIQGGITHSISSTINVHRDTTVEEISKIYWGAYEAGLKGLTVYRDGCRDGILTSIKSTNDTIKNNTFIKRPKVLKAEYHQVKSKGTTYIVLVGLLNNNPYEIFIFKPLKPVSIETHFGEIKKIAKGHYNFNSNQITIENLHLANECIEEKACSIFTSMLLRHNVDIKFIIKTAKKVNENISSFSSAMCRILAKYTKSEEIKGEVCPECGGKIIYEAGCYKCIDCAHSKCS